MPDGDAVLSTLAKALRVKSQEGLKGQRKGCFLHPSPRINTDQETPLPMLAAIVPSTSTSPPTKQPSCFGSHLIFYTDFSSACFNPLTSIDLYQFIESDTGVELFRLCIETSVSCDNKFV